MSTGQQPFSRSRLSSDAEPFAPGCIRCLPQLRIVPAASYPHAMAPVFHHGAVQDGRYAPSWQEERGRSFEQCLHSQMPSRTPSPDRSLRQHHYSRETPIDSPEDGDPPQLKRLLEALLPGSTSVQSIREQPDLSTSTTATEDWLSLGSAHASQASDLLSARESAAQEAKSYCSKEAHLRGECRPCAYIWNKPDGCRRGETCKFCHLDPPGEFTRRKKTSKRQQKRAQRVLAAKMASG
mmetsp:Transcript_2576/g.6029  ORF Transcript_2576/g.6029 Transcript_2576/m.6029 type:complete len:238 (+) Transcript_2576:112-825(+)